MFSKLICLYVAVVCVHGAPPTNVVPLEKQQPTVIAIVAQSEELESNGTFKFSYETANGIKREETSYDKVQPKGKISASSNEAGEDKDDDSNEIHVQQGSYSYTAPDGSVITVRYIADENGFRPIGDHLPKAPALLLAATTRASKNKADDNAEGGSESAAVVVAAPARNSLKPLSEAPKEPDTPKIESRIADQSSEQPSTANPDVSSPGPEEPSTTPEDSSTSQDEPSTITEIPSTTAEVSSTTEIFSTSETATTELALLTTSDVTLSEVTSTEAASTTEQTSSKATSSEEISTPAASTTDSSTGSTPNSDPTTEVSTLV